MDNLSRKATSNNIIDVVKDLQRRMDARERSNIGDVAQLSDISSDLGWIEEPCEITENGDAYWQPGENAADNFTWKDAEGNLLLQAGTSGTTLADITFDSDLEGFEIYEANGADTLAWDSTHGRTTVGSMRMSHVKQDFSVNHMTFRTPVEAQVEVGDVITLWVKQDPGNGYQPQIQIILYWEDGTSTVHTPTWTAMAVPVDWEELVVTATAAGTLAYFGIKVSHGLYDFVSVQFCFDDITFGGIANTTHHVFTQSTGGEVVYDIGDGHVKQTNADVITHTVDENGTIMSGTLTANHLLIGNANKEITSTSIPIITSGSAADITDYRALTAGSGISLDTGTANQIIINATHPHSITATSGSFLTGYDATSGSFTSGSAGGGTTYSVTAPITLTGGSVIGHDTSGVAAGTYQQVTVDIRGHVTAGSAAASMALDDLSDVDTAGKTTGGTLYWNGSAWVDYPLGLGSQIVNDMSFVYLGNYPTDYMRIDTNTGNARWFGGGTAFRDDPGMLLGKKLTNPSAHIEENDAEGTLTFKSNCDLSDWVTQLNQINHDVVLGADIGYHIHWFQTGSATPNFLIETRYQQNGAAKTTAWTKRKWLSNIFAYTAGSLVQITDFGEISPPEGAGLSDIVQVRLLRDCANTSGSFAGSDTAIGAVDVLMLDPHFEIDGLGSDIEWTKDTAFILVDSDGETLTDSEGYSLEDSNV